MKLSTLLEDSDVDHQYQLNLRRGALELQTLLMDLDVMDLDVELQAKPNATNAIVVKFNDKNNLVHGKVELRVAGGDAKNNKFYRADCLDGQLQLRRGGFDANMILFRLFKDDVFFKPFEQSLLSAFGTSNIHAVGKVHLKNDEPYGANIAPPFKLESYLMYGSGPAIMVHDSKIINSLTVCITSASTVRIHVYDSNGDEHVFEGKTVLDIFPRLREFYTAALEAV